jgi:hypothetical protein
MNYKLILNKISQFGLFNRINRYCEALKKAMEKLFFLISNVGDGNKMNIIECAKFIIKDLQIYLKIKPDGTPTQINLK